MPSLSRSLLSTAFSSFFALPLAGVALAQSDTNTTVSNSYEEISSYSLEDVQRYLQKEGLYAGAIDSIWGPGTRRGLYGLSDRAHAALDAGQAIEAEELFGIVSVGLEKGLGRGHPDTLANRSNLALAVESQGRYEEAEKTYREVVLASEEALGRDHPQSLRSKWNLAVSLSAQGRYAEAEALLLPVVESATEILGSEDTATLGMLNSLAGLALDQGRYEEAEASLARLVGALNRLVGPEHPFTLTTQNNLALSISAQRRFSEAEELYRKVALAREKVLGSEHPSTLTSMHTLALSIDSQERHAEAEKLFREVAQLRERVLGSEHPQTIDSSNLLAVSIMMQGRDAQAEEIFNEVLERREAILTSSHPDTIGALNNLAASILNQKRYPEAEELLRQALDAQIANLGQSHPRTLGIRESLALSLSKQGKFSEAIGVREEGLEQLTNYFALGGSSAVPLRTENLPLDLNSYLDDLAKSDVTDKAHRSLIAQGWLTLGKLDFTIGDLAARTAVGSSDAEVALREYHIAREKAQRARDAFVLGFQKANLNDAGRLLLAENWRAAELLLKEKISALEKDFLSVASVSLPSPLSVTQAQSLLRPGEALLAYAVTDRILHSWLVTDQRAEWLRQDVNAVDLNSMVGEVRSVLDVPGDVIQKYPSLDQMLRDHPYPVDLASILHEHLVGKFDLSDVDHLIVAPDGALETLPFAALISGSNADGTPRWLIEDFSLSVIPTTSSLRVLRGADRDQRASSEQVPYLGIAPVEFTPGPESLLRQRLSDLPGTRREVTRLSEILNGEPEGIVVGKAASEHYVKSAALDEFAIISFATHGLLSSETAFLTDGIIKEPALILSDGNGEDGILTASEVLGLRLQADWVLLTACNTSAGEGIGAEGLSGLARAFFFAGSDALLVSHWAVSDMSAETLVTDAIAAFRSSGSRRKSQALRDAMLNMQANRETSHPFHWAAFDIVGD